MKIIYQNTDYLPHMDLGIESITFSITGKNQTYQFMYKLSEIPIGRNMVIPTDEDLSQEEKIICQIYTSLNTFVYFTLKNGKIVISHEDKGMVNYPVDITTNYSKEIKLIQTGAATFSVIKQVSFGWKVLFNVNELLSRKNQNEWYTCRLKGPFETNMVTLSHVSIGNKTLYLTYYPKREKINISKIQVDASADIAPTILFPDRNNALLSINGNELTFNFRKAMAKSILLAKNAKSFMEPDKKLSLTINKVNYYIYTKQNSLYITTNIREAYGINLHLHTFQTKKSIWLFGKYFNSGNTKTGSYDYLYIKNQTHPLAKFKRLFAKKGKSYAFLKLPIEKLLHNEEIHRGLSLGTSTESKYPLYMRSGVKSFQILSKKKYDTKTIMLRVNVGGGTSLTILPFSKEHSRLATFKIWLAQKWYQLTKPSAKVNLFFEKKSSKADESGIQVFDYVVNKVKTNSRNYFILDKNAADYKEMKKKYGRALITKFSFKHYYLIFAANYFVSSELSNHVLNDRLFVNRIRSKIISTPLIFLQHGIMFAKPIDNPMASGFNKKNLGCNVIKTVISSKLEAQEFYKVNYTQNDLLLTGLATFDKAVLDESASFYAYMPTYRYWEEYMIYNDQIEQTTYYQDLLNIIHAFEKHGMLEKLLIVPHNKFADYIADAFPAYQKNICTNPSEALRKSLVFITDYSSAIYDAIMRGAYPIFYWKDANYLIDNYKAIPPVNEENAPGPIAYDEDQLIEIVKQAEKAQYMLSEEYQAKYKRINEFDDRQNTKRIAEYLQETDII